MYFLRTKVRPVRRKTELLIVFIVVAFLALTPVPVYSDGGVPCIVPQGISLPVVMCVDACNAPLGQGIVDAETGTKFYWAPPYDADTTNIAIQQIAWTNFTDEPAVRVDSLIPFFCGGEAETYFDLINTTQGLPDMVVRQFRCAFLDPLYDSVNKTCGDGACDSELDTVVSWSTTIGLVADCPPASQGQRMPVKVVGYARILLTDIFALGSATNDDRPMNCACNALGAESFTEPVFSEKAIIINAIECKTCSE
jgi:hypothetical protein